MDHFSIGFPFVEIQFFFSWNLHGYGEFASRFSVYVFTKTPIKIHSQNREFISETSEKSQRTSQDNAADTTINREKKSGNTTFMNENLLSLFLSAVVVIKFRERWR